MKNTKNIMQPEKRLRLKDLPQDQSLGGVRFKHPQTGATCIWCSQWGYKDGKAGVWYKTDEKSTQIHPLFLDKLEEALEFEVACEDPHS